MDTLPFIDELHDYIYKKDIERYNSRFNEIEQTIPKNTQEYVELLLVNLTNCYLSLGDYKKLKELIMQYEPLVMLYGSDSQKALFLIRKGVAYSQLKDDVSALECYKQSLKLCKSKSMSKYKFGNYINLGIIYNRKFKYHKALNQFLKAYQLEELPENSLKTTSILSNIGVTYLNLEDYQHAIFFLKLALKTTTKMLNTTLPKIYDNLVIAYALNKDIHLAEEILEVYKTKQESFFTRNEASHDRALGIYYTATKNYEKAITYYHKLLNASSHEEDNPQEINDQLDIAKCYLEIADLKNFTLVIESINASQLTTIIPKATEKLLTLQVEYFKKINDPVQALEFSSKLNNHLSDKYYEILHRPIVQDTQALINKFSGIAETALKEKVLELKTTNQELINQKKLLLESLEELTIETELREKLISIITHDIRSPIASVLQLLSLIDDYETQEEKDEIISDVVSAMKTTYTLTNELVCWARDITEGKHSALSSINCNELIPEILSLFHHQIKAKEIRIENRLSDKYSIFVHKASIQTCFRNLIHNAIKYSNSSACISINELVKENEISYIIQDEGIGMKKDKYENIFNSTNISTLGTNNEQGIGLGLILVKELVLRNNGRIECISTLGKGTTFTLTFKIYNPNNSNQFN